MLDNLNLNEIIKNAEEFELLPEGSYPATIKEYVLEMSKTNKPMIKWLYELDNKRRFYNYNMLDNEVGIKLFAQAVKHGGYMGDMENFSIDQFVANTDIVGNKLLIVLGIQDYEDSKQNYVKHTRALKDNK